MNDFDVDRHLTAVPDFPVPGVSFKDVTPLLADAQAFRRSVEALNRACSQFEADLVAGFDARGFLWAAPLALDRRLGLAPIRKAGKLPRTVVSESFQGEYSAETVEMHADAVKPGQRVLLVDDVIATGAAMRAGCALVERLGGTVSACAAVIRLRGLGAERRLEGYRQTSLIDY